MTAWLENSAGQRFVVKEQCTIGRLAESSVVLDDSRVSRWHALIHQVGNCAFWIVDYGSKNGVYLNGRRLVEPSRLRNGDEIRIAGHRLWFRHKGGPAAGRAGDSEVEDQTEPGSDSYTAVGHSMVVLSKNGEVRCLPEQASAWLKHYFGEGAETGLPDRVRAWMEQRNEAPLIAVREERRLVVRFERERRVLFMMEEQSVFSLGALRSHGLTLREAEVMRWMAEGKTTPQIATICETSPRTVEKHIEHIFEKLGVETRAAAVVRMLELLRHRV